MSSFDLRKPNRPIQVGVVLTGGQTEILDVAPVDMLYGISKNIGKIVPPGVIPDSTAATMMDIDIHWVTETGADASLTSGITLKATDSFKTCPPLDIVLMGAHNLQYKLNDAEIAFVQKAGKECSAFLGICGGFICMNEAGLLKGKSATAPRLLLDSVRQANPETEWLEKRWHRDGKMWTSGTLLNGLDMMTAFVADTWGAEGNMVQFITEFGSWPVRDNDYSADTENWKKYY